MLTRARPKQASGGLFCRAIGYQLSAISKTSFVLLFGKWKLFRERVNLVAG
jgi:hypothetical protein